LRIQHSCRAQYWCDSVLMFAIYVRYQCVYIYTQWIKYSCSAQYCCHLFFIFAIYVCYHRAYIQCVLSCVYIQCIWSNSKNYKSVKQNTAQLRSTVLHSELRVWSMCIYAHIQLGKALFYRILRCDFWSFMAFQLGRVLFYRFVIFANDCFH